MPWSIVKGGGTCAVGEWAVLKDSDGSTAGCHPSEEAAKKQMAALYANEADRSYSRSWDLEDVIIRAGGDGRTVEAYAAVFNSPSEIQDQHGHYLEEIDPTAFNRTLSHGIDRVSVFYHHGMTIHGTPSDLGSVPIGRAVEIRPDKRGLLTVTRYNRSDLADATLESIRNGDPMGYSFRGRIIRSNPKRPPRPRGGQPSLWRHLELGLAEYGPTPSPAYAGAGIVAVRAHLTEAQKLISSLTSPTPPGDPGDDTATPNLGPGAEDPRESALRSAHHLRLKSEIRARGVLREEKK